ncbi:MAG: tyrosine-type recombinase/integrase [Halanaeroarchaeum sp.]
MASTSDPVEYFVEDMAYHGRSERTRAAYERVLDQFRTFLQSGDSRSDGTAVTLAEATHRDCLAWIHDRRGEVAPSTIATYASYLNRFYSYMVEVGEFDENPMTLVVAEMDEQIETDPSRRDFSVPEMRSFVASIGHPLDRTVVTTLLKTGIRAGELANLDVRDVNVENTAVPSGDVRPQLRGRPDSLFVPAAPSAGDAYNGEIREESNKRKRDTVIPIDDELKSQIERWFAIRPDTTGAAEPLFVSTDRKWGQRLTGPAIHHLVERHAREAGWYETNGGAETNVTPHYFRHFFTTHLRDRTGDRGIVKYLRGDVASDVIDTYTHDWGDRVRRVYEENVYRLFERRRSSAYV